MDRALCDIDGSFFLQLYVAQDEATAGSRSNMSRFGDCQMALTLEIFVAHFFDVVGFAEFLQHETKEFLANPTTVDGRTTSEINRLTPKVSAIRR